MGIFFFKWAYLPNMPKKKKPIGGDQKVPSILLIFKYVNKQNVLIPNMVSKLVYVFLIKSYDPFSSFFFVVKKSIQLALCFQLPIHLNRKRKLALLSKKTTTSRTIETLHD